MSFRSVLIVDDSPVVWATLAALFEEEGYFVRGASTLSAAYELLGQAAFTFVLLDINLGAERGPELIPHIRELAPGAKVVILSGECEDVPGADAMQEKGEDFSKLLEVLEGLLPNREQQLETQLEQAVQRIEQLVQQNQQLLSERNVLKARLEREASGSIEGAFHALLTSRRTTQGS